MEVFHHLLLITVSKHLMQGDLSQISIEMGRVGSHSARPLCSILFTTLDNVEKEKNKVSGSLIHQMHIFRNQKSNGDFFCGQDAQCCCPCGHRLGPLSLWFDIHLQCGLQKPYLQTFCLLAFKYLRNIHISASNITSQKLHKNHLLHPV